MLHRIKASQFYTDLGLKKTVLNPLANGKIQGLFNAFECFSSTFKANLIFKDFSRQCKSMTCLLYTVNSEISARILFSGIALKDIFATLKMHD